LRQPAAALALMAVAASAGARVDVPFNAGWRFHRGDAQAEAPGFDDAGWERVTLPHTPRIEPYPTARPYQGVCWYRKTFAADDSWREKGVYVQFGAAMTVAEAWFNGRKVTTHAGGYLPFTLDLTDSLKYGEPNTLAVRLDNSDNSTIPPGKPNAGLDFCCFGGLHRGARLVVTDPVHVTDAVAADRVAGGGVFVRYPSVSDAEAVVEVQVDVANQGPDAANVQVSLRLTGPGGREASRADTPSRPLPQGQGGGFGASLRVPTPALWHPDAPNLYSLKVTVERDGKPVDEVTERIGIRRFDVTPDGLLVNGRLFVPRGANRHNDYPHVGNAIPDNAQYRDARLLKEAGFNFLRLAHYPQPPEFVDACDELGIFVMECIPGWQHFDKDPAFTGVAKQNVRDMVRRDRNHPCVLLWEMSLNETYGVPDALYKGFVDIAREEYPGGQLLTCGDTLGRANPDSIGYDVPYSSWEDDTLTRSKITKAPGKVIHREYGDYEFGGENSTSRVGRRDGEAAMLHQAWNYQWSHNRNLSYPWTIGDAIWVGIDHQRGCSVPKPASECGSLDGYRLPKFVYEFYRSQRDPSLLRKDVDSGPMVYIANMWVPTSSLKVVVYSNSEEVELLVNGKSLGRRKPDSGPDSDHAATFDGGNARHIAHPPFTFPDVPFSAGTLKAVGYIGGHPVARFERRTPGTPVRLAVRFGTNGRPLAGDGTDVVWAYAEIRDAKGALVWSEDRSVTFSLKGSGELLGPATVKAEAGVAAVLVRGLTPGTITVTASADGLSPATKSLKAVPPREASL
jgi:beta-galactosidase